MIIAIDGPAASGKGTMARRIAKDLGVPYLDTGSLYRAVGVLTLRRGGNPADATDAIAAAKVLDIKDFTPADLRTEEAGNAASKVAAIAGVRAALLAYQRTFAAQPAGAVMDGRDVGTVVCPEAHAKIFVTASLEVRVQRRIKELREKGESVNEQRVWDDMVARDERDSARSVAPLKPADDAFVLDTSSMNADEAFAQAKAFIVSKKKT
ncbi:MAG: (d)CMP kinase [Proteobacteria bacterium]|nr:(d)CMP kinase [Pseudomonadota bacterium]